MLHVQCKYLFIHGISNISILNVNGKKKFFLRHLANVCCIKGICFGMSHLWVTQVSLWALLITWAKLKIEAGANAWHQLAYPMAQRYISSPDPRALSLAVHV